MSYFSDTSSTCSAPPLTPSPYQSNSNDSHSYSSPTPNYDGSTTSPPPSIRNYSSELIRKMSVGLNAAMKDLKDDRGGPERKFDVEYGYDEDPIERHVRLFLTPRKLPSDRNTLSSKALPELGLRPITSSVPQPSKSKHLSHITTGTSNKPEKIVPATAPRPLPLKQKEPNMSHATSLKQTQTNDNRYSTMTEQEELFRPGLIHFQKSDSTSSSFSATGPSSAGSSSLLPPRPPYSRYNSNLSNGSATSVMSEDSFEVMKAEDIVSMYGNFNVKSVSTNQKEDPFEFDYTDYQYQVQDGEHEDEEELNIGSDRSSMFSNATTDTIRPTATNQSPQVSQQQQQQQQRPPTLPSRPSFTRKRSRVHPYETSNSHQITGLTPLNPSSNVGSMSPGGGFEFEDEPHWLSSRTVSEQMVAQAGLRCQRQRVGAVRR
ncbi:uncharacterized protein L201_005096 [Kwoniella dendrophila CBS 6074]|uniref:Uncharacterized protein n=1 Tax=Kwoniella dendrophila CBS 6074 TaxID=1295534 RepID=A0AAX4K091_9TREE